MQAAGGRDDKILANYFPLVLKLTQPSVTPSTGQSKKRKLVFGDYFPAELPEAAAKKVTFICSPRRKENPCASTFRDSVVYSTTSQTSTLPW